MIGVLCIHGFTGSPKEIDPLVKYLQENTDWLIKTPTLPGHGTQLALKGITYEAWIHHAEQELQELLKTCHKVFICGFSMGGLIGSWLAARYPVEKLVLLSTAAYYTNPKKMLREMMEMVLARWRGQQPLIDKYQQFKYKMKATPLSAYVQFRKLVQAVRPILSDVGIPTFIVQGKEDPIVPERSAHFLYRNICSEQKRLLFIENANHMICYCRNQTSLFSNILTFLNEGSVKEIVDF